MNQIDGLSRNPGAARQTTSMLDRAAKFATENPIVTGSALATFFGLCSIYAYHFHIEFFPVFDLQVLASVVFGAAFVGAVLLLLFCLILIIPTVQIGGTLYSQGTTEAGLKWAGKYTVLSGISFIFLFLYILIAVKFDLPPWALLAALGGLCVLCVLLTVMTTLPYRLIKQSPGRRWAELKTWFRQSRAFTVAGVLVFSAVIQFLPVAYFFNILASAPGNLGTDVDYVRLIPQGIFVGICILGINLLSVHAWFNPNAPGQLRPLSAILVLFAPTLVSFIGENPGFLWARVAYVTKSGNYHANELSVTAKACSILASSGNAVCQPTGAEVFKVCHVHILSGLGVQSYVLLNDAEKKSTEARFRFVELPSPEILGREIETKERFNNLESAKNYLMKHPSRCTASAQDAPDKAR